MRKRSIKEEKAYLKHYAKNPVIVEPSPPWESVEKVATISDNLREAAKLLLEAADALEDCE